MKKADGIIIVVLLALALGGFGAQKLLFTKHYAQKYVAIYLKGKLYKSITIKSDSFKKAISIKSELGSNEVLIENGGARMESADCRDRICIKEGFKSKVGQTIVCLPNKLVIEIKGRQKTETDEVSY